MKRFAVIVASLICFAGCARNDSGTSTAAGDAGATDTTTASGGAASGQVGQDTGLNNYNAGSTTLPSPGPSPTGMETNHQRVMRKTNGPGITPPQPLPPSAGAPPAGQSDLSSGQPSPNIQNNNGASAAQDQPRPDNQPGSEPGPQ